MRKKIAIIGAGISGLSVAYYLQKRLGSSCELTLFDKNPEVGGWIQTKEIDSALFECGPKSLRTKFDSGLLLELIEELGISECVIESAKEARIRYLAINNRLCPLPYSLKTLVTSPFLSTILGALIRDLVAFKGNLDDETVSSFFTRRCGKRFHDTFIGPLTAGIYATRPSVLSMKSVFKSLVDREKSHRSLLLGALFSQKSSNKMITFRQGIQFLPKVLQKSLQATFFLNTPVQRIEEHASCVIVETASEKHEFDRVISTLSAHALARTLPEMDSLFPLLQEFSSSSVVTVFLGWKEGVTLPPGFGFLCSPQEEKELLGIVFDSNVFPEHNGAFSARISVMFSGVEDCTQWTEKAAHVVKKYLNCNEEPTVCFVSKTLDAIGRYEVGHTARCEALQQLLTNRRLHITGTSFYGVSVGDCLQASFDSAAKFAIFCTSVV